MGDDVAVGVGEFADVLVGVGGVEVGRIRSDVEDAQRGVGAEGFRLPG